MSARVLVIEDNPANLALLRTVLDHGGYEVLEAPDADLGLRLAAEALPDLILLDIQLPGMDGVEALMHLRADAATAHIPAVAVTAHAMVGDRERLLGAGFDAYVPKPVRYKDLLSLVKELLERPTEE